MVVGFTTTYAISAYHHWCCEFESQSGRGVQHYVIKFVSDLLQVSGFLRVLRFLPSIKLTTTIWLKYCWKWHLTTHYLQWVWNGPPLKPATVWRDSLLLSINAISGQLLIDVGPPWSEDWLVLLSLYILLAIAV
jgi:hypothetical protein